jgi:predicted lactoylglutathione lyase
MNTLNQIKLGTATQFIIGTTDLHASFAVYEKLGFKKLAEGQKPNPFIHITDGSILIMLVNEGKEYLELSYLAKGMDETYEELKRSGVAFEDVTMAGSIFFKGKFRSPEGVIIDLVNYDPVHFYQPKGKTLRHLAENEFFDTAKYPNARIGIFGEFSISVKNLRESLNFWRSLGFQHTGIHEKPYPWTIISDDLNIIGLHQTTEFSGCAITYFAPDMQQRIAKLKEEGVTSIAGFTGASGGDRNGVLTTPEGQKIFLFSF